MDDTTSSIGAKLNKALESPRCHFEHALYRLEAEFILSYGRPCGCKHSTFSRPSLACAVHKEQQERRGGALTQTKCPVCGKWSFIKLLRTERIG